MTNETTPPEAAAAGSSGQNTCAAPMETTRGGAHAPRANEEAGNGALLNELAALSDDIADSIRHADDTKSSIIAHARLLNHMLCAVTKHSLNRAIETGDYCTRETELLLRIQRSATDTVKALAAVEYMETITLAQNAARERKYLSG